MALYKDYFGSVVRFLRNFDNSCAFFDFDAHANLDQIPAQDVIGLMGFGFHNASKFHSIIFNVAVSTYNDPDMVRHVDLMDALTERLAPTKQVPICRVIDGSVVEDGWMVVAGDLVVEPTLRVQTRALQTISVQLLSGDSGRT